MIIPLENTTSDGAATNPLVKYKITPKGIGYRLDGVETKKAIRTYYIYKFKGLSKSKFSLDYYWDGEVVDWNSIATFSFEDGDDWQDIITLNHDNDGLLNLAHQPNNGDIIQLDNSIPRKTLVKIEISLGESGIMIHGNGNYIHAYSFDEPKKLYGAHFGLYCGGDTINLEVKNINLEMEI